jgi:hypothetical protein
MPGTGTGSFAKGPSRSPAFRIETETPLSDRKRRKAMTLTKLNALSRLAALALVMALPAIARADVTVLHRARLVAVDPMAGGHASDYETLGHPFDARLAVHVREIFSTDAVDVVLNGDYLGTITLTDGRGKLILQGLLDVDVPYVETGDVIEIFDAEDGTLLLYGTFD